MYIIDINMYIWPFPSTWNKFRAFRICLNLARICLTSPVYLIPQVVLAKRPRSDLSCLSEIGGGSNCSIFYLLLHLDLPPIQMIFDIALVIRMEPNFQYLSESGYEMSFALW